MQGLGGRQPHVGSGMRLWRLLAVAGDDSDRTVAIDEADTVEGGKEDFVSTPENVRPLKMNCRGVLVSHKRLQ